MLKYLLLLLLGTSLLLGQMDFTDNSMNFGDEPVVSKSKKKKKTSRRKKIVKKRKKKSRKKKKKNSSKVTLDQGSGMMNFGEDPAKKKKEVKKKVVKKKSSGMSFDDASGGMSFGTKVEQKKETKKDSGGMDFGTPVKATKSSDGMDFGGDSKGSSDGMDFGDDTGSDSSGMDFGNDPGSSGGMDFGNDSGGSMDFSKETLEEDDLLFDLEDDKDKIQKDQVTKLKALDKTVKPKKLLKEEKVKIVRKPQNYIEKGTFFRFSAGPVFLLDPKISGESGDEKSIAGTQLEMAVGVDFTKEFSTELFVTFLSNKMQRRSEGDGILYNSDINGKVVGLGLNYSFISNNRFYMTGSLHGGVLLLDSSLDDSGLKFAGGAKVGMEYYLLLRHFSILVTGRGDYLTGLDTVGLSLSASIKYSF